MSDFLKASPFDPEYDLNQTLTPAVFYDHLHVSWPRHQQLSAELDGLICSKLEPNRVIFVRGFAGNGKTTFLKTFIRDHPQYRNEYFDFQEQRRTVHGQTADYDPQSDEILLLLKRRLRRRGAESIRFMIRHRDALKDADFISARGYERLKTKTADAVIDDDYVRSCFDGFDFKDTFACFFADLFLTVEPGKKTVAYFDNLDVAPMEHIAERFLLHFQDALLAALYASRHEMFVASNIDFRSDFRFIFCFRDANEAILNAHLGERIGFARTPFTISSDAEFYKAVATRRIRFLKEEFAAANIGPHGHGRFSRILNVILSDTYFKDVFLPLYNYDYRELVSVLVNVIASQGPAVRWAGYEMRSRLMYGIVQTLLQRDFMHDYLSIPDDKHEGYCYVDRVMLTVLINASGYRRDYGGTDSCETYPLYFLVKDLMLVYQDLTPVLESIARCFLFHQQNRVHLITILNRRVENIPQFVSTFRELFEEAFRSDDSERTQNIKRELKKIQVRANPSGFTYVRYVLPHFEFYANLARNGSSLFDEPLRKETVEGVTMYAFERKIDAVLHHVERHLASMSRFFAKRYIPAGLSAAKFPSSKYCFRHAGNSALALSRGQSHTVKIITAHINHIEQLRWRVLSPRRWTDAGERVRVNQLLVSRIARYVDLLGQALDADVAKSFAAQFQRAIQTIVNSGYTDFATEIRLEHDEEAYRPLPRVAPMTHASIT